MIRLNKPKVDFSTVMDMLKEVLNSGNLTQGKYLHEFEKCVSEYIGVKHAIATSSATTALHLSLEVLGIQANDEILVSDFTFPATGNVICQVGAKPVLVDCNSESFDMCLSDLKNKITDKAKAIMVVDPFGQPVNIEAIMNIASQHNLYVIEDAACALGARRGIWKCGNWADFGVFSFHPRKIITTGEGGMITTNDDKLAKKAKILLSHGSIETPNGKSFILNGFNYRMSEINAILGIEQINKVEKIIKKRQDLAQTYIEKLQPILNLSIPLSATVEECTFQSFVILLEESLDRDKVIKFMKSKGIETTIGTYAMHTEPAFSRFGYKPQDLLNSYKFRKHSLTLPLHEKLSKEDIDYVVRSLATYIAQRDN